LGLGYLNQKTKDDEKKAVLKMIKHQVITPDEQGRLLRYMNLPENKEKYHLTNDVHEDRIGKYWTLTRDPNTPQAQKTKLYLTRPERKDLTIYLLQYYDLLRDEKSNSYKALRLSMLQKNIEFTFAKHLKILDRTNKSDEISQLLQKVKKARAYYSYKMLLDGKATSGDKETTERVHPYQEKQNE